MNSLITQPEAVVVAALITAIFGGLFLLKSKDKDRENKRDELNIQKENNIALENIKNKITEENKEKKEKKDILDKIQNDFHKICSSLQEYSSQTGDERIKLIEQIQKDYKELYLFIQQKSSYIDLNEIKNSLVKFDMPFSTLVNYAKHGDGNTGDRYLVLQKINDKLTPNVKKAIENSYNLIN